MKRFACPKSQYHLDPIVAVELGDPPSDFAPAPMGFDIEKKQLNLFKFHEESDYLPDDYFMQAVQVLREMYRTDIKTLYYLTYEDALCAMHRECLHSSAGAYWHQREIHTKGQLSVLNPLQFEKGVKSYLKGKFQWFPWSLALKDEMLKAEKVLSRDTRLFTVAPPEHYLACLMVFSPFCDFICRESKRLPIMVGIETKYGEWQKAVKSRFTGKCLSIDGKKYDTRLVATLMWFASLVLQDHVVESYKLAAEVLIVETIYALLVTFNGVVVAKHGGNASGGYLTLTLNCLAQLLLLIRSNIKRCGCLIGQALVPGIVGDDGTYSLRGCKLTCEDLIFDFGEYATILKDVEEHSSLETIKFCGMQVISDRLMPRETKFYASVFYRKGRSLVYDYQRLLSLWIELFENPVYGLRLLHVIRAYERKYKELIDAPLSVEECLFLRYGVVDYNTCSTLKTIYAGLFDSLQSNVFYISEYMPRNPARRARRSRVRARRVRVRPVRSVRSGNMTSRARRSQYNPIPRNGPRMPMSRGPSVGPLANPIRSMGVDVEPCAWEFAAAILNPRDGPFACLPVGMPGNTGRLRVLSKTSMTLNAAGEGFVMLNPGNMIANDATFLYKTGSTYATTPPTFALSGTGIATGSTTNSPYATAAIGSTGVRYRLVAAELRITLTSTGLNQSGFAYPYESPSHNTLSGMTADVEAVQQGVEAQVVSYGKWISVRWRGPTDPEQTVWCTGTGVYNPSMGITIQGSKDGTNGSTFLIESYGLFEIIGTPVLNAMPSTIDPMGFAHVSSKLTELGAQGLQRVADSGIWQSFTDSISQKGWVLLERAVGATVPVVANLLKQRYGSMRSVPRIREL